MPSTAHVSSVRLRSIVVGTTLALAVIAGCYTGPKVDESPPAGSERPASGTCEPNLASIRQTVLLPRCATAGCHSGSAPAGELDLQSDGLEGRLVGIPAAECVGQTLVVAGSPGSSYLLEKLVSTTPACGFQMPSPDGIPDEETACIRAWITSLGKSSDDGGSGDAGTDASTACPSGQVRCNSVCVDTANDPKNCGTCGTTCDVVCIDGGCSDTCPGGKTNCSGSCVDTTTSNTNCGSCGNACTNGKTCKSGDCACGDPVRFASQLQPILTSSCTNAQCHSTPEPAEDLVLTQERAYAELVNVRASSCTSARTLVTPGSVDDSYLVNKLTGSGLCSGTRMPKNGALSNAQIDLFRAWICNGAPND